MQSYSTFTIMFFVRKSRHDVNILDIYARITVNQKRAEISLKRSIPVYNWDVLKHKVRGNTPDVRILNKYLDFVYTKLLVCHKQLLEEHKMVTSRAIKARYLGQDDIHKSLKELVTYHNTNMITVLKSGTMKNYYTTERYLSEFLLSKMNIDDLYLMQLNYRFICDFEQFLRLYRNNKNVLMLANNGVMKHLMRLKKMVNLAVKLEWIDKNPFQKFQLKFTKYDRQYLNERELELIENTHFNLERLERVKDIFLFSCYTGLAYIDVKNLTVHELVLGIDNRYWIHTKREKTNELVKVPLLPKAYEIVKKYKWLSEITSSKKLLPVCSNQITNRHLKEIAKACGIHKNVTFHVARHTFATTLMLTNGVPIETVSKLLGHTQLSTTQIYARVIETKISEDMDNLLKRFETKAQIGRQTNF
jgi:integrase